MSEYEFRVLAVNANGISEPLTSSVSFLIKLPFGAPGAPEEPTVHEIGNNFVTLQWNKPSSDGGGPITGYWVDKKEKGTEKWIRSNLKPLQTTAYNVPNLIENQEYEFRVFAENEAGLSEPSAASKLVKVMNIIIITFIDYLYLKLF